MADAENEVADPAAEGGAEPVAGGAFGKKGLGWASYERARSP